MQSAKESVKTVGNLSYQRVYPIDLHKSDDTFIYIYKGKKYAMTTESLLKKLDEWMEMKDQEERNTEYKGSE